MVRTTYGEFLQFLFLFQAPSSFGSSSSFSSRLLFPLFYFICIGDLPASITCVQCPERPEESIPGLEPQIGCKLPHGCWKLNLGHSEKQNLWAFSPVLPTITFLIWKHLFCPLKSLLKTASVSNWIVFSHWLVIYHLLFSLFADSHFFNIGLSIFSQFQGICISCLDLCLVFQSLAIFSALWMQETLQSLGTTICGTWG